MLALNIELQPQTELRIRKILDQHEDKEMFFRSIIQGQVKELKIGMSNIEIDLKEFERKYQVDSRCFYQKFKNGEMGDDEDYMIWAGLYEMQLDNQKRLSELE